ncbi:serine/threonine-protein phosphatase 2A regulatory subunit B'' subunit alpha-like [Dermacentor albipictus]|uniref:serine/threonine-protein phosphatase 2A regulatory subunit B'' subunit alpha-like n=1 Tax=Dermacentor albipictus TaxID=60249 RepID=UPI0038FD2FB4
MSEPARPLLLHDAPHPVEVEVHRLKCSHRTPFCMASHPNDGAGGPAEKTGDQDDSGGGGGGVARAASLVASLSVLSTEVDSDLVANVSAELCMIGRRQLKPQDMERIIKVCRLPLYLKFPMYQAISKTPTRQAILEFCRKMHQVAGKDRLSKAVFVLTKGRRTFLQPCDFRDLIQDLIDTHSGLAFLKEVTRSHSVYIDTVVARLFFEVGKTWTWRLGMAELRRSDFLSQLDALELHNDFMNVEGAFSYKDAYVIHTMFNSLDKDNDRLLNRVDLTRYEKGALVPKAIDRVFDLLSTSAMTYVDFVVFLLAEKDKSHPRSIEYWFNRLDLDGDGKITMYELETFFHEQYDRVSLLMNDPVSFEDVYRQMIDLVKPKSSSIFALSDLKRCALASVFFNTFINTFEFIHHEVFDPFDTERSRNGSTQWDQFAKSTFSLLMEEGEKDDSSDDDLP